MRVMPILSNMAVDVYKKKLLFKANNHVRNV